MRNWASCGALACVLAMICAGVAHAGPIENMRQVALKPGDPDTMIVRFKNGGDGLLYSQDGGKRWHMVCSAAIDQALRKAGTVLIAKDGAALMGVDDGLWQDDGTGCGWSKQPVLKGYRVRDLVPHPSDPDVSFALASVGTETIEQLIYKRDGSGAFREVGLRQAIFVNSLHVGETASGLRFYEAAADGFTTITVDGMDKVIPNYVIRVSDDDAVTWQQHPMVVADGSLRVQAVDPLNADRIVATIERDGADDSVIVSIDQGATFTEYLKVTDFGGLTLATDGRIWIGDMGRGTSTDATGGLWFAPSLDVPAQRLTDIDVLCVAHEPASDTVYVCQRLTFGAVGVDGSFTSLLAFGEVDDFVDCPDTDMAALCEAQLCIDYCARGHFSQAPVCAAYDGPVCGPCVDDPAGVACADATKDAGMPPRATDAGMAPRSAGAGMTPSGDSAKSSGGGCACLTAGAPPSSASVLWLSGLALGAIGARRRGRIHDRRARRERTGDDSSQPGQT